MFIRPVKEWYAGGIVQGCVLSGLWVLDLFKELHDLSSSVVLGGQVSFWNRDCAGGLSAQ